MNNRYNEFKNVISLFLMHIYTHIKIYLKSICNIITFEIYAILSTNICETMKLIIFIDTFAF